MTSIVRSDRLAALVVASAAVIVLAACSSGTGAGSSSAPTAPPFTSASTSIASPVDKAKQDALAAYLGMWQDFVAASATSDWQSSKLGRYATGTALNTLSRGLYADHYKGLVTKGEPTHSAQVSTVEPPANPTKGVVTDCSDSTNALKYRADNGQLADNTPGGRRLINGIVERQGDGSWKVSDFGVREVGSC